MSEYLRHLLVGAGLHELAAAVRTVTKEEALADYDKLRSVSCSQIKKHLMGRIGNKASDHYFFEHRLATKSKRGEENFAQFFKRKGWHDGESYTRLYKMGIAEGDSPERSAYSVFGLYWGAISSFKAVVARWIYCKYKPTTILDFSAGWGGRCLAAMSLDINYIGFDTNTDLKKAYSGMIHDMPHTSKAEIHFQDSAKVDYSKYNYDFVFTSPPYYQKTRPTEGYKNMPMYADRDDFNKRFLFPVVENTYKHMKPGHYCLNVPMDMYDDIKSVLGACDSKMLLPKVQRGGSGAGTYKEYIYVWNKGLKGSGEFLPKPTVHLEDAEVKKSGTHGLGAFAKEDIPKGTKIADYKGEEMMLSDFKKKYGDDYRYTYSLGRTGKIISGKNKPYLTSNISHYTNESKTPNVFFKSRALYAGKNIKAGDELFLTYPENYPRDYIL